MLCQSVLFADSDFLMHSAPSGSLHTQISSKAQIQGNENNIKLEG